MGMVKFLVYRLNESYNLLKTPINLKVPKVVSLVDCEYTNDNIGIAHLTVDCNNNVYAEAEIDEKYYGLYPHVNMIFMSGKSFLDYCSIVSISLKKKENIDPEVKSIG